MRRWQQFAGLADTYRNRPLHIVLANPFAFAESVYPKVEASTAKAKIPGNRKNFSFHRQTTHPAVDRRAPAMVPGWNSTNHEIRATGEHGCYVIFDRSGEIVFQGRLTFEEVEARVRELLRQR